MHCSGGIADFCFKPPNAITPDLNATGVLPCALLGDRGLFLVQGRSSVGRASVSKTEGHGFESCRPCHFSQTKLTFWRLRIGVDPERIDCASVLATTISSACPYDG